MASQELYVWLSVGRVDNHAGNFIASVTGKNMEFCSAQKYCRGCHQKVATQIMNFDIYAIKVHESEI